MSTKDPVKVKAKQRRYRESHKEEIRERDRKRYAANLEERRAYSRKQNKRFRAEQPDKYKDNQLRYRSSFKGKATKFLQSNRDCSSSHEEIEAIYSASINMITGQPGRTGKGEDDLVLDHIHNGPAVGLIPRWLNGAITSKFEENLEGILGYLEYRREGV